MTGPRRYLVPVSPSDGDVASITIQRSGKLAAFIVVV